MLPQKQGLISILPASYNLWQGRPDTELQICGTQPIIYPQIGLKGYETRVTPAESLRFTLCHSIVNSDPNKGVLRNVEAIWKCKGFQMSLGGTHLLDAVISILVRAF